MPEKKSRDKSLIDKKSEATAVKSSGANENPTISEIGSQAAAAPKEKAVIEIKNAEKTFSVGRNVINVLKNINVTIRQGEFIVILGPSGSGKSTLLNVMLGLEPPTKGTVAIEGVDITHKKPNQIAKIRYKAYGIVFQRPEWIRSLSVLQNVALPLAINGISKNEREKKALEKLKIVGMDDHSSYFPMELSGGQQQKVTMARALINDANIVVADEPTGNLDSKSAEKMMDLLKSLNEEEKKTVLMVTHNIDYVRYASRTVYIRDGRVIEGSEQFLQGM
ncbi:MAG: ABC transporter ATP-binding protein [Patescibacteria group bacterium]|jgi:putative ABC transport system ATP-binding protein